MHSAVRTRTYVDVAQQDTAQEHLHARAGVSVHVCRDGEGKLSHLVGVVQGLWLLGARDVSARSGGYYCRAQRCGA